MRRRQPGRRRRAATGRTPSTGNQQEWSYSHFVLGNKQMCCHSLCGSCNCMPHMLSYMRLYNAHSTIPPLPLYTVSTRSLFATMLNANGWLKPSTRRHNNKKKDSRALMSASWQRGVLADLQRSTTHTPHTHTHSTHRQTKATIYSRTLKPKDFYCARYGVLIDIFCINGILRDLNHKLLSMTNCRALRFKSKNNWKVGPFLRSMLYSN